MVLPTIEKESISIVDFHLPERPGRPKWRFFLNMIAFG
jgi:hypothetical protein